MNLDQKSGVQAKQKSAAKKFEALIGNLQLTKLFKFLFSAQLFNHFYTSLYTFIGMFFFLLVRVQSSCKRVIKTRRDHFLAIHHFSSPHTKIFWREAVEVIFQPNRFFPSLMSFDVNFRKPFSSRSNMMNNTPERKKNWWNSYAESVQH